MTLALAFIFRMHASLVRFVPGLLGLYCLSGSALADVYYVDANLTSGANDGSSWSDALQGSDGLQAALSLAVAGDQVFVAEGTYKPTAGSDRQISFQPANGVEVYGGFLGGEASPAERPPMGAAPSVLSGDLLGNDGPLNGSRQDNSRHVVLLQDVDDSCVVDGFRIVAGYAKIGFGPNVRWGAGVLVTGSSAGVIRGCKIVDCRAGGGGGAIHSLGAGPTIERCIFEDNQADFGGGAIDLSGANGVRILDCEFRGNQGSTAGAIKFYSGGTTQITGCLFLGNSCSFNVGSGACEVGFGTNVVITNCTLVGNMAPPDGVGGIGVFNGSALVENCILWGNLVGGSSLAPESQLSQSNSASFCTVEGGFPGSGNSSLDPQFVDASSGDYRLLPSSPALDAGDNSALPPGLLIDLDGRPRASDVASAADVGAGNAPIVDMGAFELHEAIGDPDAGCIPLPNSSGVPSLLVASGSLALAGNSLYLDASDLPPNQFAYFVMSMGTASTSVGSGVLCLGSPLVRFSEDVLLSSPLGNASFAPALGNLPQGQVFQAGETWWFQLWHRDLGGTSNLSNSLGVLWQ